ncbi:MAG: helix-turn-helix domain-containing protein [Bacteroidetes bacterium]|nr:helix-turn-helix domain-containing protein [Bacteroidota bacterium]
MSSLVIFIQTLHYEKHQIIRGSSTAKEQAFELGFDSISSFSRFFKNNVGVSPSQFRAEN